MKRIITLTLIVFILCLCVCSAEEMTAYSWSPFTYSFPASWTTSPFESGGQTYCVGTPDPNTSGGFAFIGFIDASGSYPAMLSSMPKEQLHDTMLRAVASGVLECEMSDVPGETVEVNGVSALICDSKADTIYGFYTCDGYVLCVTLSMPLDASVCEAILASVAKE